ncbi:MAG: hypothetical protein AB7P49_16955 [Bdellovibrionales bacterium]
MRPFVFVLAISMILLSGCSKGFESAKSNDKVLDPKQNSPSLLCTPSSKQPCSTTLGVGTQTCNSSGTAWGTCGEFTSCNSGYNLQNGTCVANVCTPGASQSCTINNGSGTQTCNSSGTQWGACGYLTACNSGYNLQNGTCVANVCTPGASQSCTINNGTGTQTCNSAGSQWGACGNLTACNSGYELKNGACVVQSPCGEGWLLIKGIAALGTSDFCIMKYEAQNPNFSDLSSSIDRGPSVEPQLLVPTSYSSATPTSAPSASTTSFRWPWVYVSKVEAEVACARVGAHLTTMMEAQTINRHLLSQPLNWSSNAVGQGCMYGGHLDGDPQSVLPTAATEDLDGMYFHTNDSVSVTPSMIGGKCFSWSRDASVRNGYLSRRALVLPGNEFIWDWSGNASEWIADTCNNNGLGAGAVSTSTFTSHPHGSGSGYFDYFDEDQPLSALRAFASKDYVDWTRYYLWDFEAIYLGPRDAALPGSEFLDSRHGVGMYYGCRVNGNAIYRGGAFYHGPEGGIFHAHLDHTINFNHPSIGFRCAKAPR